MIAEKKRILHVIKGLGRGGAERLLLSTIKHHSKEYSFDIVFFLWDKNQLRDDLIGLGCSVYCLHSNNVLQMVLNLPEFMSLLKKNKYHLIHAHLPWSGIVARLAGKLTKTPVVYTEHNLFSRYNKVTQFFSKVSFNHQSIVIAVSVQVASSLRELVNPKVPLLVIQNGVDVDEFDRKKNDRKILMSKYHLPTNACIIGTVTALSNQKRIDRWLTIAAEIASRIPDVYFVIVGDGVLRMELERQASPLIENGKLTFAGITSDPASWMACMDIFLMSSDYEGLPVALLEAMSMSCVPVATKVGGIPSIIENGLNGVLYEATDIEFATSGICNLLENKERRKTLSENARSTIAQHFSVKKMVASLEKIYSSLIV